MLYLASLGHPTLAPSGRRFKVTAHGRFIYNFPYVSLSILSWNCNGHLALKISHTYFVDMITSNDICFIQETYLSPSQEDALPLPSGYTIATRSRPVKARGRLPAGGVAVVVKDSIPYMLCSDFSSPDLIVMDFHSFFFIGAYIVPQNSNWRKWSSVDPALKFAEAVTFCTADPCKPLLVIGDLNARTGSTQTMHSTHARSSCDDKVDARGKWLIDLCNCNHLHIINGTSFEDTTPGRFTSYQVRGSSVVDYVIVSTDLLKRIRNLHISPQDDHATLSLSVSTAIQYTPSSVSNTIPTMSLRTPDGPPTPMDMVLERVLATELDEDKSIEDLYGPMFINTDPSEVYIACSSGPRTGLVHAYRSGVCCYWRDGKEHCLVVEGPQNLGLLFGLVHVLQTMSPYKSLLIRTTSDYLIRTLTYDIGKLARQGWFGQHMDIIKYITQLIHDRSASLAFAVVDPRGSKIALNLAWKAAMKHAQDARRTLHPMCWENLRVEVHWSYCELNTVPLTGRKVTANIPPHTNIGGDTAAISSPPPGLPLLPPEDVDRTSESHRGRAIVRRMMWDNYVKISSCRSSRDLWTLYRAWADPKHRTASVSLDDLKFDFELRMNPPKEIPAHFDSGLYALNHLTASAIPDATVDVSPNADFSRPFVVDELEWAKRHIRTHSLNTAKGIDRVAHERLLDLDTKDLVELANLCVSTRSAPRVWLCSLLVGILKKGRSSLVAESYRLIALECCLLKLMTLLIDRRYPIDSTVNQCSPNPLPILDYEAGWHHRTYCHHPRMVSASPTVLRTALSYFAV